MNAPVKSIGFVIILSLLSGGILNAQTAPDEADVYEAYNFRFDGKRWTPIWLQCDADQEVVLISPPDSARRVRYETYHKISPSQRTVAYFLLGEGEGAAGTSYQILEPLSNEGHKQEHEYGSWIASFSSAIEGQWIGIHSININRNRCNCRWFPQTRFAGITGRRSVYVTVSDSGKLEYRSFNFSEAQPWQWPTNQIKPSVLLQGGFVKLDSVAGVETFTFGKEEYTYVVEVGLPDRIPSAHIVVKKNNVEVQRERCQSFAYATKVAIAPLAAGQHVISDRWIDYNGPDFTFKYPETWSVEEYEDGVDIGGLRVRFSVANDDELWEHNEECLQVKAIGGIPAQSYCYIDHAGGSDYTIYGYRVKKQDVNWTFEWVEAVYPRVLLGSIENDEERQRAIEDWYKGRDDANIEFFSKLLSTFKFIK